MPEEAKRVRTIMQRYLEVGSVPALIAQLRVEGILTKVQQRTSGPHRGGIPFARGSLFHLLKNPVYRGMIVHKGKIYDGEHDAVVDPPLWHAVQAQLKEKAPPRKRPKNDRQQALLIGLLADRQGRPMVPTYASKGARRYAYYETRKDLAQAGGAPSTRFAQGMLEAHILYHLGALLDDDHTLRRLASFDNADGLRTLFAAAKALGVRMGEANDAQTAIRSLVTQIKVGKNGFELTLRPVALGLPDQPDWHWSIPLPMRKPFREAKIRIDAVAAGNAVDQPLVTLLGEAIAVQSIILGASGRSINQIAQAHGRCRKQMTKLLQLSWLSPRIVEAITSGHQPRGLNRTRLLEAKLPIDWNGQEQLLGFTGLPASR